MCVCVCVCVCCVQEVWSEERWCEWLRGQLAHCHTEREVRRGNWAWLTKVNGHG